VRFHLFFNLIRFDGYLASQISSSRWKLIYYFPIFFILHAVTRNKIKQHRTQDTLHTLQAALHTYIHNTITGPVGWLLPVIANGVTWICGRWITTFIISSRLAKKILFSFHLDFVGCLTIMTEQGAWCAQ
jgi:hypothetical protein